MSHDEDRITAERAGNPPPGASVVNALREALAELDGRGGPEEIAAYLAEVGVTGRRAWMTQCPLACWFRARLNRHVEVDCAYARVRPHSWDEDTLKEALPRNVALFVVRFDTGEFPRLEERP